jgi:LacI family transcriptional regulator, repressor for deo operon, udp, cdd, tsx, nupC, and nupG
MSDVLALGAIRAATELGIGVPTALSVVGFHDSPAAWLGTPR